MDKCTVFKKKKVFLKAVLHMTSGSHTVCLIPNCKQNIRKEESALFNEMLNQALI